jgi:uncharacterized protein (DUF1330 family)
MLKLLAAAAIALSSVPAAADGPKAYMIAEIAVTNPAAYEQYKALVAPMIAKFGGRYLARGGRAEALEGAAPAGRVIILEFPSFAQAKAFYDAPEYRAILHHRTDNATSRLILVEGFAP